MMARIKLGAALACALLLSACAVQNKAAMDEVGMPQVPPTVSMAEADAKLKQVSSERDAAESAYAARELVCYDRFFVNNCLDQAKETRRVTLMRLRAIEAEASHFQRAESVRLRDADLARTQQDARDELAERTAATSKAVKVVTPEAKPAGPTLAERQAQHAAELKQQAAQDAAEAPQRAAREANFARKQAEAVKRQERVARRLAEREKAAAAKAARAAAAASAPPPPIGDN